MAAKIGMILEQAGYRVILQQWDFANRNFMERMDAALASGARVIAVMTPQYLATDYCAAEWMHVLGGDPLNRKAKLIVLRTAPCEPLGLLRNIAYWDLVPICHDDGLLADIVHAAIMPDADRRAAPVACYWREPQALLHAHIKPTSSFQGRKVEFAKIEKALWSNPTHLAAITQPTAVTGLGGIGKSALAREYGWGEQARYAGVWWLDAERIYGAAGWDGIEQGLTELGDHYIPGLATARDRAKAARHALAFLSKGGFDKPWLLIFDNVNDARALSEWRPASNVHVLATTRIGSWQAAVTPIEISELQLHDAVAYLRQESGRADIPEASLQTLAEVLGCLPLALAHAAAYLRHRRTVAVDAYLGDLSRHMSRAPKDADYQKAVYATFQAAIADADTEAPGAAAMLSLAAFFAPNDIPEELFQQKPGHYPVELTPLVNEPRRLAEALGALDDLSLVDFLPQSRTFSVHRLVQAAARDQLAVAREAWALHAANALFAAFPEPTQETLQHCARLVAHVRAIVEHVPQEATTRELGWLL